MRKIIAAFNITIDGFCNHDKVDPAADVHDHYTDLLGKADAFLYGRKTYQLMQFWQELLKKPSGQKSMDDFAKAIDQVPKIVFSNTLHQLDWHSAELATESPADTVKALKQQPGKDIYVGSRTLIADLTNQDLIDELQLCVHPVILGQGLPLFDRLDSRKVLKLERVKTFESGPVILYYTRK